MRGVRGQVLANLIMHFEDRTSWRLSELAEAVGMPPETVPRPITSIALIDAFASHRC